MRIILGLALAVTTVSGASSADLGYRYYEPEDVIYVEDVIRRAAPRHAVRMRRVPCIKCPGAHLPYGGLRRTYEVQLPYGGLPEYCPPALRAREVVLVRKG